MHRFKASKYKNSVTKCPKKEECITDIKVETPMCNGNHIKAGTKFIGCNIGSAGSGNVGIFAVGDKGRKGQLPSLAAHGGSVTDIDFSPFYHELMITSSEDMTIKLWKLPSDGPNSNVPVNPVTSFSGFKHQPELLQHHPIADDVLAVSAGTEIQVWNINSGTPILECDCNDVIQSISWSGDGKTIFCTTKSKRLKVVDPRSSTVVQECASHENHKDSRIICLGETGKIATSAFTSSRQRQLKAWDQRNIANCLQTLEFGTSTGVMMPFYDPDTGLLFLAGKADSSFNILEVSNGATPITQASQSLLPDQTKGMCLLPKLCVDVMSCEVDRLIQLCSRQLVPITIEVPRRSHSEFASELFPDTMSDDIVLSAEDWFQGKDGKRLTTSLNPSKRKPLRSDAEGIKKTSKSTSPPAKIDIKKDEAETKVTKESKPTVTKKEPEKKIEPPKPSITKPKPFAGVRQSKFRHWTGTVLHPSNFITNIPQISRTVSGACNGFEINTEFAAVPLATPGGPIAILQLSKPGRITSELPTLQNNSVVTDFKWNPFNNRELAVGLDNGTVKIWDIPEKGLKESIEDPNDVLEGHYSKITSIEFHPLAVDILATTSLDMNVIIWNLESNEMAIQLSEHKEEILSMSWSANGKYLATISKDSLIRIYEPRESTFPISEGPGSEGSRGARVVWVCDDSMLFVSGFSRNGVRSASVHDVSDLKAGAKGSVSLDNAPATLVPFYDEDTRTVFLTGKGDSMVVGFEVLAEDPYLLNLASFNSTQTHKGFCFLPKSTCDARKVEFARAWRLGKSSLEPVSFKVPRVKMEYFQDDIFPDTRKTGVATMTADQWLSGGNQQQPRVSMRPSDMKPLSEAPKEAPKQRKYESYNADTYKTDEEKKEELLSAMSNKLDLDKQLEQDTMEGVDDDEWDDY